MDEVRFDRTGLEVSVAILGMGGHAASAYARVPAFEHPVALVGSPIRCPKQPTAFPVTAAVSEWC